MATIRTVVPRQELPCISLKQLPPDERPCRAALAIAIIFGLSAAELVRALS